MARRSSLPKTQPSPDPAPGEDSRPPQSAGFFSPSRKAGEPPSWTDSPFESDSWVASSPNPGVGGREAISFQGLPERFRRVAKEFLAAMDQSPAYGRRRAKSAGSARTSIAMLGSLARHLDAAGVQRLADATRDQIEGAHASYCGLLSGEPITAIRAARYLSLLGQLHALGPAAQGLLSDGLAFDPSAQATNVERARSLRKPAATPELSEETGRALMLMAIDWVESKTEAVLWIVQAHAELSSAKAEMKSASKSAAYALKAIRARLGARPEFLTELEDARAAMAVGPLRSLLGRRQPVAVDGASDLELDCMAMGLIAQQAQLIYQGFCYVVCAGFNGWRANEIFSMDASSLVETPAGHSLLTKVRKTALRPEEATARPVPPIVARAVRSLARLNERSVWGQTLRSAPAASDPPGSCGSRLSSPMGSEARDGAGRADGQGTFAQAPHAAGGPIFRSSSGALIDTHDMNERITAAWRHFTGSEERVTTHQFRRFFALFYLRRYQGNLDAIRRHFRHVSRDMVWAYVKDGLNADYLAREKKALAAEIARSVVFEQGYASAGVAKELKEIRASLKFQGKTLSVEDAAAYLTQQIEMAFVDVHPMEWGYCLLQRGQSGAACEGKSGPIESRSEPQTCGRCKFLCAGPENIAFWQQSALLHQEILAHPKVIPIMRTQSERALATAANILARHAASPSPGETL